MDTKLSITDIFSLETIENTPKFYNRILGFIEEVHWIV